MEKENKLQIYPNRDKSFQTELKKLEEADINHINKELITKFHNYLFSTGSGHLRVAKLSSQLRRMCLKLNTDLDKLLKKELIDLIALYNKDIRYADATKSDYRRAIQQFYKWLKPDDPRLKSTDTEVRLQGEEFYRYLEEEVKAGYKRKQADPSTIITDEDCDKVVEKGCISARDKAYIAVLHESGTRVGEFLQCRIGSVQVLDNHAVLNVDGKTGKRSIFLVKSLPYLLRYLDIHPFKDNKQSYLWLSNAQHNNNEPLLHKGSQKLIERCFKRAKVDKRHNLHWFRHSRATILAPKMTESMLCKFMGWSIGSRQVRTYCHLSVKQLEDVVLGMHGVRKQEDEPEKPIKCICGTLNNPNERYCFKCCKPLKVETVIQDKELVDSEINKTMQFMMEMAKNPKMMEKFMEFRKEMNKCKKEED